MYAPASALVGFITRWFLMARADGPLMIGSAATPFSGNLNGRGRKLSSFSSTSTADNRGLFAVTNGATISNLTVENFSLSGGNNVGVLVGDATSTSLSQVKVRTSAVSGAIRVGGMAGRLTGGTVDQSQVELGTVTGTGSAIGGFVGQSTAQIQFSSSSTAVVLNQGSNNGDTGGFVGVNVGGGGISGCQATGSVTANFTGGTSTILSIGGFVGQNGTISSGVGTILSSTSSGAVVAKASEVGGFVGTNGSGSTAGYIEDCQSTSTVNQNDTSLESVGGFVGLMNAGHIKRSGATGALDNRGLRGGGFAGRVTGTSLIEKGSATGSVLVRSTRAGGFVGYAESGTIRRSFATGNAIVEVGGNVGGFVGQADVATIDDCYARGTATGGTENGGAFGGSFYGTTVRRSYANGVVTIPADKGRFVGQVGSAGATLTGWIMGTGGAVLR